MKGWLVELKRRERPLSPATIAKAYRLLREILAEAVEDGYLTTNPANIKGAGTEPQPDQTKYERTTPELVLKLADHMRDEVWKDEQGVRHHRRHAKYRLLILLAGLDGPRWGEAIALQRKHCNLLNGTVRVEQQATRNEVVPYTKTEAGRRTIDLTERTLEALRHHLDNHTAPEPDAFLFLARARNGETALLRESNFRRSVWLPALKALGAPKRTFHDLRHAAGTLAASTGAPLKDIMRKLGHTSMDAACAISTPPSRARQRLPPA